MFITEKDHHLQTAFIQALIISVFLHLPTVGTMMTQMHLRLG